jgi:hypothetical protein
MKIAFYKGRTRLFNRFVCWWTRGPYSHCEAVFDGIRGLDGPLLCGSASFMDGGVRLKVMELKPEHWDILEVPALDGLRALDWFNAHSRTMSKPAAKYDLIGLLSTSVPVPERPGRFFCNEAVGASVGLAEPWRYTPNSFAHLVALLPGSKWIRGGPIESSNAVKPKQPASAG